MVAAIIVLSILSGTLIGSILTFIWLVLFTLWTLGVGKALHALLPDTSTLNLNRFYMQIGFVIVYLFYIIVFTDGGYEINNENIDSFGWKVWIIIPLHLFFMYSIIHTIYFLSRCITTLRSKNEGYGWYMLGFWVYPIGIWMIQPKIIELLNKENTIC